MLEQPKNKIFPPEGSSDEVVAAIEALSGETENAEREVRELLQQRAAERLAEKSEPGDA